MVCRGLALFIAFPFVCLILLDIVAYREYESVLVLSFLWTGKVDEGLRDFGEEIG